MRRETLWEDDNSKCVRTYNDDGTIAKDDVFRWNGNDKQEHPERHTHKYSNYNNGDHGMHGENVSKENKRDFGRSWNKNHGR